ncbi:Hypothetical protein GSB_15589 [Giardia duodenalis]|uniref:Uncharacterized protein n=2 Tax=Giardia intestinalis TaxID=5741 RepID=C6LVZ8_GIAIB|nr:Hypothetical protein GL50581_2956 [Giardia intestinalis ATCC 50581]ESU43417.1 Hypothetical protein GSB_15589 [Giardia intestinalis]
MDVAIIVYLLDGSHVTIPATQDMLVRDLKAAIVARLCLKPLEAATCGFFQISAQGLDIFISEDTMLVDVYSPKNRLIKRLLFTLIVPDVSGVRSVVEDSKLRAKCSLPEYYSECSAVYRGMLIHHALDKIRRGHVLAHSDRFLEGASDLCCYFIAVKYGALILKLNQHIIPLEVSQDLKHTAWDPEALTESVMQGIYRDARSLLKYSSQDAILLDFLYCFSKLALYDSLSIPAMWIGDLVNKGGGQTVKMTDRPDAEKSIHCYLLLTREYICLASRDSMQIIKSVPVQSLRRLFYYSDYLSLYFSMPQGQELYLNLSVICTENCARLIETYYTISYHMLSRYRQTVEVTPGNW